MISRASLHTSSNNTLSGYCYILGKHSLSIHMTPLPWPANFACKNSHISFPPGLKPSFAVIVKSTGTQGRDTHALTTTHTTERVSFVSQVNISSHLRYPKFCSSINVTHYIPVNQENNIHYILTRPEKRVHLLKHKIYVSKYDTISIFRRLTSINYFYIFKVKFLVTKNIARYC